ncbi:sensor histidine kinase [Lentzea sp. NPDC006480]|uniref:sensor histidine kinase n=1 Tax=Lentzea sp. NPDC006480 TaxID=3157176 RepID=UPI0033A817FE
MRPLLFTVLFWVVAPAVLVVHLLGAPTYPAWLGVVPLAGLLAVLVALWFALPWEITTTRKAVSIAFVIVCVVLAAVDGSGLVTPLVLIGLGNVTQVFGTRWAFGTLAVTVALFVVGGMALYGQDWVTALRGATIVGVLCAFGISVAAAVRKAVLQAEEIRRLAVAEERARMAREMHDSLGHYLTVVKMGLENAERLRERATDRAWDEVRQAKLLTMEALTETRRSVRALRPLVLEGRRGSDALRELARTFDGLRVRLQVTGQERELGPDAEIVLYRAFQEGLTNVLRHAEAAEVTAELSFSPDRVVLVIGDDGRGAEVVDGFGLVGLGERVEALGGAVTAGNRAAGGFELRVELPA